MGLFSFLKNAGNKLFHKDETPTQADPEAEAARIQALKNQKIAQLQQVIANLGLRIDNGSLDINDAADTVTVHGQAMSQAEREKIILAIGNTQGVSYVDDQMTVLNHEAESIFYEVEKGDSLSKIAKAHYGDMMKYRVIFEANRPMLKDPDEIYPGQMLRIPPVA